MPPNMYFLSTEADPARCALMHGTCASQLERILAEGLLPRRARAGKSNWQKNPSHEDAVYLTTAYSLHYANAARAGDLAAILTIDVSQLDQECLVADEDSYALSKVEGCEWLEELSLPERVAYWREELETTDASQSLRVLGNCAYLGPIPPAAISGVRLLTSKEAARLTVNVSDPAIAPQNFKIMGGALQRFSAWLGGRELPDDAELVSWFESVVTPTYPVMPLAEAVAVFSGSRA